MALEKAISNVNKYFGIIGISEQFNRYVEALEHEFPEYFRGIFYLYNILGTNNCWRCIHLTYYLKEVATF